MPDSNQKFEDMTWWDRINVIRTLSLFPAITVMVFIRRKLGFRMMKPTWLVVMTIIMLTIPAVAHQVAEPFAVLMVAYALAMLGLGLWQRWQRWKELCNGERWHTFSPGISYLENLPWPPFMKSHRRVNRFIDPAAVAIAGLIIGLALSHGLGIWIIFSAFFLYVFEQDLYEKQLNHDLDTLDGLFASEVQAEVVKHFEQGETAEQRQQTLEETAGIPTGLAPDIHKQVELRRAKQRKPAPDNLAPETPESPT
jgi:hypothetical protein